MIIDFRIQPPYRSFLGIHFHRQRPRVEDPVKGATLGRDRRWTRSFDEKTMDVFLREMDEVGIDKAVIMGQQAATRWGSVINDDIADLVRVYPGRFFGFAGVDPTREGVVEEIRRSITDLGLHGLSVLPGWSEPPLFDDDKQVYPIYETCLELGVPVMITSSHWIGADMTYSMPTHIQRVALDFPELTIIIGHGCWPWTTLACALAMRCSNVYLMPEFYMYVPDMPGADDYVRAANSYLSHRMLYSSCYPSRCLEQALEEFCQLPIKPSSQENMLWHNGARILGLAS
jgi:hypothetical protein